MRNFFLKKEEILFVGDSVTDLKASKNFNLEFILRLHQGNVDLAEKEELNLIKDFEDLEFLLKTNYS